MLNPNRCLNKREGHVIIALLILAIWIVVLGFVVDIKHACADALPSKCHDWDWLSEQSVSTPLDCQWQGNLYK